MRSIERRFNSFQSKDKDVSTYANFARAVRGQKFSKGKISFWFKKLVDPNDYDKKDKRLIINLLTDLSNTSEEL